MSNTMGTQLQGLVIDEGSGGFMGDLIFFGGLSERLNSGVSFRSFLFFRFL